MSTIRLGTAVNIRLFQTLSAALVDSKFTHLIDGEAFEDEFGRLRVWSGNLGALQKGHSALDYRLRDSPLLSSNALKLLKELEENISEAIAIVTGARLPYEQQPKPEATEEDDDDFFDEDEDEDEESETGPPKTELEQRFREIIDIIDNLYKLSVRIRTPTIRSRSLKASSYRPKDPETGVDILDQYAVFDLEHTRDLVRCLRASTGNTAELKEDDILVTRLSKAITLRRRQFKYWRRHRDKLGVSTVQEEAIVNQQHSNERPDAPHRHNTLEVQVGNPIIVALKEAASEKTGKSMLSGTEATRHHQSLDEIMDSRSVTSYATTVRDLTGRGIDLPPPPQAAEGDKDFECPYCFIICPARYGKGRAWRTHLLQDLQPYLCTYVDCESPDQLFRSRREWSDHEATHRKAWRCPEHPHSVYRTQSGLRDHFHREHPDSFPESQMETIIKVGETSTVDTREKCPICFFEGNMEGGPDLQHHVANHLERFAAFALPRNINDDSDGASSAASRGRSGSSGSQDLSDVSFHSEISEGEENDPHTGSAMPDSTSLLASRDLGSSSEIDAPLGHGMLSAEMLGQLPDSSQKRLDVLFPLQAVKDDDFEEWMFDKTGESEEAVEELSNMQDFRAYLLALPGAQSVRFLRRFGLWRGYTKFVDEASAVRAIDVFDHIRFPAIDIKQGVENKAAIKFSFPGLEKAEKEMSPPSRQTTSETGNQDDSSISTAPIEYHGNHDKNTQSPILSVSKIPTLRSLYRSRKLLQRDQSYAPNDAFNQTISFCFYDITRLKVDAIVNSANRAMKVTTVHEALNHHVHIQAGPELAREVKVGGKVKTGQVRITPGYNLPSTYVIHAARPHYSGSKGMGKFNILTECYRSSLKTAMAHDIKTIAFPCLAAGGCGFPSRVAARIALQEVREFLDVYKGYEFERIIFCVYSAIDEKAYKDFLPVFFPPTHGDLENATPFESTRNRVSLATQLQDAHTQITIVYQELVDFSENVQNFPRGVLEELASIITAFRSLQDLLFGSREEIRNLNGLTVTDIDLICSVMQSVCGGVLEIIEQTKYTRNFGVPTHKSIWDDYNFHMKNSKGMDLHATLEICANFVQVLDDILARDGIEPYEMATMRVRLGTYRLKHTGEGLKGTQDLFDEVMYTREFQRGATPSSRADTIKLHQVHSIARLYQIGDLEYKPTYAIASANFNHIVYLLRDDITRVESDIIVNSTDPRFSSMGTLDRTVFKKGGPEMIQACSEFGTCKEGDVKVTLGYLLPAKHVLHAIPPETYRSNTKDVLRKLYREILYTAGSLKATSITIPTIGTGMLNYPSRECASLALEEVKRFLESAEPTNSLEKIIFCVFSSNDEHVYKSLLPVYFPPVDLNLNKALPPGTSAPSVERKATPKSTEPAPPPKRSLFGSIGEAFRNVRFGKQPATDTSRPTNPAEEHALSNFEAHAQDCDTCKNIAILYAEGRTLCPDGYAMAQLILQYLYMEADRSVYSTNQENGQRIKVEIPPMYRHCWNLLVTVEMSYRDEARSSPFVSPNQPWTPDPKQGEQREEVPSEVTMHSAEALASISVWSDENESWQPHSEEGIIHVYPGKVQIYTTIGKNQSRVPLFFFDLTPAAELEVSGAELMIDKAFHEKIKLRCFGPTECEMLYRSMKHAIVDNIVPPDQQATQRAENPRAGTEPEPKKAKVFFFTWSQEEESFQPLRPDECSIHVHPGKAEIFATDARTKQRVPLLYFDVTSEINLEISGADLIIDKAWRETFMLRCPSRADCEKLLLSLEDAKGDGTAPTELQRTQLGIRREPESALATVWVSSQEGGAWQKIHPNECSIYIYHPGKVEVYETGQTRARTPLLSFQITPTVTLEKITRSDLIVEEVRVLQDSRIERDWQLWRIKMDTESSVVCEMLFQMLKHKMATNTLSTKPLSSKNPPPTPQIQKWADATSHESASAIPVLKWSGTSWEPLESSNPDMTYRIRMSSDYRIYFYARDLRLPSGEHPRVITVDLSPLTEFHLDDDATSVLIDHMGERNLSLDFGNTDDSHAFLEKMKLVREEFLARERPESPQVTASSPQTQERVATTSSRPDAGISVLKWSGTSWESLEPSNPNMTFRISVSPGLLELFAHDSHTSIEVSRLRLELTSLVNFDLGIGQFSVIIERAGKKCLILNTGNAKTSLEMLDRLMSAKIRGPAHQDISVHYSNHLQKARQGWWQSTTPNERAGTAMQFLAAFRLLKPGDSEEDLIRRAVVYESNTFNGSQTWDHYQSQIKARLQNLQDLLQQGTQSSSAQEALAESETQIQDEGTDLNLPTTPSHDPATTPPEPVSALTQHTRATESSASTPDASGPFGLLATRILAYLKVASAITNVHESRIAEDLDAEPANVAIALHDLQTMGLVNAQDDGHTWVHAESVDTMLALKGQRPPTASDEVPTANLDLTSTPRTPPIIPGPSSSTTKPHSKESASHAYADEDFRQVFEQHDPKPEVESELRRGYERERQSLHIEAEPRSTTPTPNPNIDLSIAGLSTINIDDFFTYLDLAASAEPLLSGLSRQQHRSQGSLTRSSSLPLSPRLETDATTAQPLVHTTDTFGTFHSSTYAESAGPQQEESDITTITHPRPTSPDLSQPAPIPPGARWTKIDRRLVNPSALEEAKERYEERGDHVIALRVLSREEIMRLAERTREIRRKGSWTESEEERAWWREQERYKEGEGESAQENSTWRSGEGFEGRGRDARREVRREARRGLKAWEEKYE